MARGIASIGAGELWTFFGEPGVGVARVVAVEAIVVEVGGAKGHALPAVPLRAKSPANLARFSSFITIAAPGKASQRHV